MISPIICAGDVLGMVIMFGNDKKQKLGESEKRIVKVAAGFFGQTYGQLADNFNIII